MLFFYGVQALFWNTLDVTTTCPVNFLSKISVSVSQLLLVSLFQVELIDILRNMFLPSKKMIEEQLEWLIEHKYMRRSTRSSTWFKSFLVSSISTLFSRISVFLKVTFLYIFLYPAQFFSYFYHKESLFLSILFFGNQFMWLLHFFWNL